MAVTEREKQILKIVVERYITEAAPVASRTIAHDYGLGVSPATVRNELAFLEEAGYIIHPYPSSGSIPSDKAYRYYVEMMIADTELPAAERQLTYQLFQQVGREIEQWLRLAATLLARLVGNLAIVTVPKTAQCRFKRLELVALHEFVALLVLVLYEARVRQYLLSFPRKITQDELSRMANRLNAACAGKTGNEIATAKVELSGAERQVSNCVIEMIADEDRQSYGRPYLQGLPLMLQQPEFYHSGKIPGMLELLEGEDWLSHILQPSAKGGIWIIIGEENPEEQLQDLSLVVGEYGIPERARGVIGVIGPKRMDYGRAISSVNYLSSLLSKSVAEYV
jgi:heat-inducible transcriptional repressor